MAHKPTEADARATFEEYQALTGDTASTLDVSRYRSATGADVAAYRVRGGRLDGLLAYGAREAVSAIGEYINGWSDRGEALKDERA